MMSPNIDIDQTLLIKQLWDSGAYWHSSQPTHTSCCLADITNMKLGGNINATVGARRNKNAGYEASWREVNVCLLQSLFVLKHYSPSRLTLHSERDRLGDLCQIVIDLCAAQNGDSSATKGH